MITAQRIPEAKIVPLANDLSELPNRPPLDLVKAWTVELVNTGVSSTQVQLSNQRVNRAGLPEAPSWRFNDFQEFKPGTLFRVDFRYVDDRRMPGIVNHGDENTSVGTWYPMIIARVVGLDFSFPQSGGSMVAIKGEDLLSRLKRFPSADVAWGRRRDPDKEAAILAKVLRDSESNLNPASVPDAFSRGYRRLHQRKNQTYLKFLRDRADELDWELFVEFDRPTDENSSIKVHFEPHRSGTLDTSTVADLVWGKNLVDFQPRLELWRQLTSVRVKGRNPWGGTVDQTADNTTVKRFLHPANGAHLKTSVEVRNSFEDGSNANPKELTGQRLDDDRAAAKAQATLMKSARKFLTATAKVVGNPALRPGRHVQLGQMSAPFDGYYYVEKARHSFDENGYLTDLTLSRPGYLDPEQYAAGGA